jgi:hypothetical protein
VNDEEVQLEISFDEMKENSQSPDNIIDDAMLAEFEESKKGVYTD